MATAAKKLAHSLSEFCWVTHFASTGSFVYLDLSKYQPKFIPSVCQNACRPLCPGGPFYQFEAIHPFLDGNGRVGRLLITLFLIERQILPTPLLYLSAFFEASRRDYYDGLRAISARGAWNDWLEYFLLGVARMSEDALSRATRINGLFAEWQRKVSGESSNNPLSVVELLGANPFITIKGATDKLAIAFTTAQRAIERLERARIVKRMGDAKRDRVYCATALLDILEEPARLKPADNK